MKKIKEYTIDELSAKINAIKAERERTANALKRYEEELELRKQEVPLGLPCKAGENTYNFTIAISPNGERNIFVQGCYFPSKESAEKHAEMLLAWRKALVANSKGKPIDIQVLLPLLVKGYVFYDPANNSWIYCINKPIKTSNGWLISGGFNSINGFNLKPAENWETSLMECGL